ncbi:hypothetical protein BsWGS_12093 [Bradybaena similaris]
MFELHSSLDLLVSVSQFIYNYRQAIGITEPYVINPKIINQERGGSILYVWNDVDKDKPSSFVTNFGVFELDTQKQTVIYTYEKKVKVVSCSVNPERTLLAFSTLTPQESSLEKKTKDVYQAYLAELQSVDKTVFSLNMERDTFLKVQFLYPDQPRQSLNKDSDMLVFLHKESIGMYRVPLGRIGDKGIIMSGQPKTEQVVRKFVWCQWDTSQQRLHYIENIRSGGNSEHQPTQKLSTIQFRSMGKYENMIDIPISFPFPYIRTTDKPHYGDIPLYPGIPELTLNVAVLTQPSGAFCLCYHKQISHSKDKATHQSLSCTQDVEYYISMIHHAKTLYGCVSNIPKDMAIQKRLVFSWLGSYLVVMLPGYFIHLLNVSPSFEPCHHILLHDSKDDLLRLQSVPAPVKPSLDEGEGIHRSYDKSMSVISFASSDGDVSHSNFSSNIVIPVFSDHCIAMKTLLPCQSFVRESGSIAQHLYDYRSGCLMKLVLNTDSMIESFRNAYWQTQLAILHYLLLHNKDPLAVRKLFEVVTEDLSNSEVNSMFSEYLVASTFAEMKKQIDKEILNLLSFTFTQTLRGQVEKNPSGHRLAHISYNSLETINLSKKWSKESKSSSDDFWASLFRRLRLRHLQVPPRFSHDSIMSVYRQAEVEEATGKSMWNPMHVEDSFFDGTYSVKLTDKSKLQQPEREPSLEENSSLGRSKLDFILGPAPVFLQTQMQNSKIFKRRLSILTKEMLTKHLTRYLGKESQSKVKNVASEYLHCQAKISRQLCHLIWSLRGQHVSCKDNFLPNLQKPGTDKEYELFQLYERFYLTAGDLGFPLPPGFVSFFTSLGFKCLELHLFFQYVDRHILTLTPDFILQLLEDLPDEADEEVPFIKFQIISRLPKPIAEEYFERWNHPMIQQRKARHQVAQILLQGQQNNTVQLIAGQEKGRRSRETSGRYTAMDAADDNKVFPPLDTLMKHLQAVVSGMTPTRPISYDTNLIENMALYNTKTKTTFDLSTVNF